MAVERNKIARTLSSEELTSFCERLQKQRGVTLQTIADFFEEETGEKVSLMGAASFRNTTFARHMHRIGKAAELRDQLRAATQAGNSIADAAALVLSEDVFDELVNRTGEGGVEELDILSKVVKRVCDTNRSNKALDHRIEQDRDDTAERVLNNPKLLERVAKIKRDDSLSPAQKRAQVRLALWGAAPADFEPVKATGAKG